MQVKIKTWLSDIYQAICEIDSFLPEQKDFTIFQNDLKSKRAIERNIEIIGEAVARVVRKNPDFPLNNARKIIDTRNRIIHGYDTVSEDIIWSIVVRNLPKLKEEVGKLLGE